MRETEDEELMAMIAQGSSPAFTELFRRHGGRVLGYCARLTADQAAGEDLAQEVWIRVAKAAPDWTPRAGASLRAWLLTIARNLSLNFLRDRKRISLENDGDEIPSGAESSEELMIRTEDRNALAKAIDSLSDLKRVAITMSLVEERSHQDIASELSMSVPAVKSLLFRARADLEKLLGEGKSS